MKRNSFWSWIVFIIGMIYFFLPLFAVFEFSLRAKRGVYSFEAYRVAFMDPEFYRNFGMSLFWAFLTIIISLVLIVPTAYWVHLRMRRWRPVVEFFTLMPFVVPAVVLVFGMSRLYARFSLMVELPVLLIAGYIVLSFPYIYRAVDTGLRAVQWETCGCGWRWTCRSDRCAASGAKRLRSDRFRENAPSRWHDDLRYSILSTAARTTLQ